VPFSWSDATALTQAELGAVAGSLGNPAVSHAVRRNERYRHTNPQLDLVLIRIERQLVQNPT
jgi:hypothetical protein